MPPPKEEKEKEEKGFFFPPPPPFKNRNYWGKREGGKDIRFISISPAARGVEGGERRKE